MYYCALVSFTSLVSFSVLICCAVLFLLKTVIVLWVVECKFFDNIPKLEVVCLIETRFHCKIFAGLEMLNQATLGLKELHLVLPRCLW